MRCYFCQSSLYQPDPRAPQDSSVEIHQCDPCAEKYNLRRVYTIIPKGEDQPTWAHIYLEWRNRKYHIRLRLQQNFTEILMEDDDHVTWDQKILRIPGFPIQPHNAAQKLKLYLLFS